MARQAMIGRSERDYKQHATYLLMQQCESLPVCDAVTTRRKTINRSERGWLQHVIPHTNQKKKKSFFCNLPVNAAMRTLASL
jgi:hypothetical protein